MASTNSPDRLGKAITACLRRHGVRRGERILVGVSGGPDSTALLHALQALPAHRRPQLVAAYCDHGLRPAGERARERQGVEELCARLYVPLFSARAAPGSLKRGAREQRRSLEDLARSFRYAFLKRTARAAACPLIAVGHTADDQAETVLMRLLQGAEVRLLRGIAEKRGPVIRPLLGCSRAQVLRYLARSRLPWHEDSSNESPQFLRNAVRLRVLPLLEELSPGVRGALVRLARQMQGVAGLLDAEARAALPWGSVPGGFELPASVFAAAPRALRAASLRLQLRAMGLSARKVPQRFLAQAAELPGSGPRAAGPEVVGPRAEGTWAVGLGAGGSGTVQTLLAGHGLRLERRGGALLLTASPPGGDIVGCGEKGYFILGRGGQQVAVPTADLVFVFDDAPHPAGGAGGGLLVRSHRPGDDIRTERGGKSVDKILSEWRVPPGERWKVPVVEDARGIVAVLGRALGYRDRVRHGATQKLGLSVSLRPPAHPGDRQ